MGMFLDKKSTRRIKVTALHNNNCAANELSGVTMAPQRVSMYPKGESQKPLSTLIPHTIALVLTISSLPNCKRGDMLLFQLNQCSFFSNLLWDLGPLQMCKSTKFNTFEIS